MVYSNHTAFIYNYQTYKLLGRVDVTQQIHPAQGIWYSFAIITNCGILLGLSSQRTFFFSIGRARHLLLILPCLIRDLGGSSRSSGCDNDK